jgi:hypothetical protein
MVGFSLKKLESLVFSIHINIGWFCYRKEIVSPFCLLLWSMVFFYYYYMSMFTAKDINLICFLFFFFFFVVVGDSSSWCSWLRGVLLPSGSEWVIIYFLIMEFVTVSCFEELLCYLFVKCSGPQDFPYAYCFFYVTFVPLRWIYYRFKKSHYYLLVCCSLVYFMLLLTGSRSFY